MTVSDTEFVASIKMVMKEVVIPHLKEYCKEEIQKQMEYEREGLYKQFCESRHERTISILQRALAAMIDLKSGA